MNPSVLSMTPDQKLLFYFVPVGESQYFYILKSGKQHLSNLEKRAPDFATLT